MENNTKRESVLSWDELFMGTAILASYRSKDPVTQVGACIAGADNRILSVGYNGAPNGFSDDVFPWGKTDPDPLKTKYPYVVHAERNAILNFRGYNRELVGSTIYVTHFPCNECAKEIIQSGIRRVVYLNKYENHYTDASTVMFKETGVEVTQFKNSNYTVTVTS